MSSLCNFGLAISGLFAGLRLYNLFLISGLSVYFIGANYFTGAADSSGSLQGTFIGGGLTTLLLSGTYTCLGDVGFSLSTVAFGEFIFFNLEVLCCSLAVGL